MESVVVEPERGVQWSRLQLAIVAVCTALGAIVRTVDLGRSLPSFDETYTANVARMAPGDLVETLRVGDSHPPLDYLLRHLVAGTYDATWLRLPSAVIGVLTLAVVVWWMWDRGWFGVFVIAFSSLAAAEVLYARQARMYALVILAGTVVAAVGERWLDDRRLRWAVIAAGATAVALFAHSATLAFAAGALLLPGLDRRRSAWAWRGAISVSIAVWTLVWLPSVFRQFDHDPASWIPYTSARGVVEAVAGQVSLYARLDLFVVVAVAIGALAMARSQSSLTRVWLSLFAAPAAVIVLLGFRMHLLLPRTLVFAVWAPVVALAALAAACVDGEPWPKGLPRTTAVRAVGVVAVALLVAPSVARAFSYSEDSVGARRALVASVEPGDAVVVHPPWLHPMLRWDHAITRDGPALGFSGEDVYAEVVPGGVPTGRAWVLVPDTYAYRPPARFALCEDQPPRTIDQYVLACYDDLGSRG